MNEAGQIIEQVKPKRVLKPNQKFEYYVNYLGHQRRNDRYITEDEVRINEEEIEVELAKYEERVR